MHDVALIGAGRIGRIHAANIFHEPRLRLAAVVDPDTNAAAHLAERYGSKATSLEPVFTDPSIKGVVIASSTDTHLDYTIRAAEAGKAVFCEKPLDQDLERARAGAVRLDALGARVLLGFNRRFDPHFAALRERLRAGAVGSLETLHIISHDPAPPPIAYVRVSGGIFKDMVIHDFDMARWLLGEEPDQVLATTSCLVDPEIVAAGDADTAKTILRTPSGKICVISSSRRSGYGYDQRIEAFGSAGMAHVGNVRETLVEQWGEAGAVSARFENFFLDRYRDAYRREASHFADMLEGEPPAIDYADGVAALALADAAQRSAREGRWVQP